MLTRLIGFEIKYQIKNGTFILFSSFLFLSGIFLTLQEGAIQVDNRYNLFLFTCLTSLIMVLQISFQCAYTVLRDTEYGMDGIIHTTRAGKYIILGSRFIGILGTSVLSSMGYVLGLYLGAMIDPLSIHDFSSFDVFSIIWPWLTIVLPDVLIILSIVFSSTLMLRRSAYSFVAGTLIMTLFLMCNFYIGSPFTGGRLVVSDLIIERVAWLDILGLCSQFEITHLWSPQEKKEILVPFSGSLLLNRIVWCFSSFTLLGITFFRHTLRLEETMRTSRSWFKRRNSDSLIPGHVGGYNSVKPGERTKHSWAYQVAHLLRMDIWAVLKSRPFQIFIVVWCIMIYSAITHNINGQGVYGKIIPSTSLIIGLILEPFSYCGLFLIVYYTGLIVWRSKSYKFNEIIDVTPVSNGQFLMSKWLTMLSIPIMLITCGIGIGLIIQISHGYYKFNLPLYLSVYLYGGISVLAVIVFSMLTQMFVSNKYTGMVVTLILIYGLGYGLPALGYMHPLSKVFQFPKIGEGYSAFYGYGTQAGSFWRLCSVWLPLLFLFCLFTYKSYNRKIGSGFKDTIFNLDKKWTKLQMLFLIIIVALSGISATLIHKEYVSGSVRINIEEETRFRVNYESSFLKYASKNKPDISSVKTWVNIHSDNMGFSVRGEYLISNYGDEIIDTIIVNAPSVLDSFRIEGAHVHSILSASNEARLVIFDPPLERDDKRVMHFEVKEVYTDFDRQRDIQESGTYLRNGSFEPRFGYVEDFQLTSKTQRRAYQLPDIKMKDCGDTKSIRPKPKQEFETWITTDAEQIAIAPGSLVDKKEVDDKMVYHYRSDQKTDNNLSWFVGDYTVVKDQVEGIQVEVYTHPNHSNASSEIIDVVKATLTYANREFGTYHYDHLRIVEVPLHWRFGGHALPGTIALNEMFFRQDDQGSEQGINQLSRVLIHELGHQWFGHKMSPAAGPGANLLTESMANYLEAEVLEIMYGKDMVNQLADFNRRRYFHFRSESHTCEASLHQVTNETYIAYRKGYIVMQAIKELMGREVLNNSLKKLVDNFTIDQTATADDWISVLLSNADIHEAKLIVEWLKDVITYDLKIENTEIERIDQYRTKVMAEISSKKFSTTEEGASKLIPMNEDLEIEITGFDIDSREPKFYRSSIRLTGIDSVYTFNIEFIPEALILDPDITRLDDNIQNNRIRIED